MCLAFSRLVDSFQTEPKKLHIIAGNDLLKNLQQLVRVLILLLLLFVFFCINLPNTSSIVLMFT